MYRWPDKISHALRICPHVLRIQTYYPPTSRALSGREIMKYSSSINRATGKTNNGNVTGALSKPPNRTLLSGGGALAFRGMPVFSLIIVLERDKVEEVGLCVCVCFSFPLAQIGNCLSVCGSVSTKCQPQQCRH